MAAEFYDAFAADYELVYGGRWDEAVERQGRLLDDLLQEVVPGAHDILDCSCGIGTQAIGLALRGYRVAGTDASEKQIARAREEASRFDVVCAFAVADFRDLSAVAGSFDAVISCDNAVPYLLDDADLERALTQTRSKLRDGGVLVITMRDFDDALRDRPAVAPTVRLGDRVLVRLHEWQGEEYTVRYVVLADRDGAWDVVEHRTRYRAITRTELEAAATRAGFSSVAWSSHAVVGSQLTFVARR